MITVKAKYQNTHASVTLRVAGDHVVRIELDSATPKQLELLYKAGHDCVEKKEVKQK